MDAILPSTVNYKVNARAGDLPIDEFSFISANIKIQPYFEDVVSRDPDVTALMVFLRNSKGEVAGWKVIYTLEDADIDIAYTEDYPDTDNQDDNYYADFSNENLNSDNEIFVNENENPENNTDEANEDNDEIINNKNDKNDENYFDEVTAAGEKTESNDKYRYGDELYIPVKSLDYDLPHFPMPPDLPMGRYTLVSQIMSGNQILHKSEKEFFYLADVNFSFDSIQVHQPGIALSSQLITKGTVIMLEAKLDFDSRLDPYIVWYNGKKILSEGSYSEGAGTLLWKAPDQVGFSSIRAETFPVIDRLGLAGYQKDISILVSSKKSETYFLFEDSPDLLHWYLFEGGLSDSKTKNPADKALRPAGDYSPKWMPSGGIYGLASGSDAYALPKISFVNKGNESWKILFCFKPLNDGGILSVQFGPLFDVSLNLSMTDKNLILSLASPLENVFETLPLPETETFITAEVIFTVLQDRLSAKFNFIDSFIFNDEEQEPLSLEAEVDNEFRVTLGSQQKNDASALRPNIKIKPLYTALWDELALYYIPYVETEIETEEDNETPETQTPIAAEQPVREIAQEASAENKPDIPPEEEPLEVNNDELPQGGDNPEEEKFYGDKQPEYEEVPDSVKSSSAILDD